MKGCEFFINRMAVSINIKKNLTKERSKTFIIKKPDFLVLVVSMLIENYRKGKMPPLGMHYQVNLNNLMVLRNACYVQ